MRPLPSLVALVALLATLPVLPCFADPAKPTETKADSRYVWDLTQLYATDADWDAERRAILGALPGLKPFEGTLGRDASTLLRALDQYSALRRRSARLAIYATLKGDEDTRIAANQERRQQVDALQAELATASAFIAPELTRLGEAKIDQFLQAEPGLAKHRFFLKDIIRNAPHTLTEEGESLLAAGSIVAQAPGGIYRLLANADIPWPTLRLTDGRSVRLDSQGYTSARDSKNRTDRKRVFDAFWGKWNEYRTSLGSILNAQVQSDVFEAKARKYPSAVEAALAQNNIPTEVYRTLVAEANAGLPTLHRYFKLRGRMLGVKDMRYYDIYPPLVRLDRKFTVEQSRALTLEAVKPLGEAYVDTLQQATGERWMHAYPQPGKRSGAYMEGGAYDVHPYLLLNHNDNYEGMSTFAHEWGHAMHSVLANKAQPYETADYPIFLAEIASTANEMLLSDLMIKNAKSKDEKLFYLGQALEQLRGTFFRQTMFAEFELKTHEAVEKGEALSGERLSRIYLELLKRYHGDAEGVVKIDDAYGIEWAFIPHFYNAFYVYQYATSLSAAAYFVDQIEHKGEPARDAYLHVLSAGGSDYPYELLRQAGLDMATPTPYRALIQRMNTIMDEMEKLLGEKS